MRPLRRNEITDPALLEAIERLIESSRAFREDALYELGELRKENHAFRKTIQMVEAEQRGMAMQIRRMHTQLWMSFTPTLLLILLILLSFIVRAVQ